MNMLFLTYLTVALLSCSQLPIVAEPLELKFRLVTHPQSEAADIPAIGGRQLVLTHCTGVAVFEDARLAHKDFVAISDEAGAKGDFKARGEYQVLSGTGANATVTGTGTFQAANEP